MTTGDLPELSSDWPERWRTACARIDQAGYGYAVASNHRAAGAELARRIGPRAALRLTDTVSLVAIGAGQRAAELVSPAALAAAGRFRDEAGMLAWFQTIEQLARTGKGFTLALLESAERLLAGLGLKEFQAFVRMGLDIGRLDAERGLAFFSLRDEEALRFLDHGAAGGSFSAMRTGLRIFMTALWGLCPPIEETPAGAPEHLRRRAGFTGGGIRVPPSMPGFAGASAGRIYHAMLAHIGAHNRFADARMPVGGLKPLQVATISLIEDARVERLAAAQMPGLARLWRGFHVARPEGPPLAIALMARLSRALADPDYRDDHGWVEKGRTAFDEAFAADPSDRAWVRRIGGLLGNDLGQMRLQFDAKSYVVQPPYRDDNLGLWDFGDEQEAPFEMPSASDGARIEQRDEDDGRREETVAPDAPSGRAVEVKDGTDTPVARYPEFDYVVGSDRPGWCSVYEPRIVPASAAPLRRRIERRPELTAQLTALIRASKVSRQQRVRRQVEGDYLDVDAAIEATIARRSGEMPDTRLYGRYQRRHRDLSVLVLVDASRSTGAGVTGDTETVLDVERLSVALLARAMSELGDPFALAAFSSDTRDAVSYLRVKDFDRPYDDQAEARLAGLRSLHSTRLGAVIRHAGRELRRRSTYRRLLLIVTDGEPHDIDVSDARYLVEDARSAVHALNGEGIDVFSIVLDSQAQSYADRIFGRRNCVQLQSVERLPQKLPALFLRLVA